MYIIEELNLNVYIIFGLYICAEFLFEKNETNWDKFFLSRFIFKILFFNATQFLL